MQKSSVYTAPRHQQGRVGDGQANAGGGGGGGGGGGRDLLKGLWPFECPAEPGKYLDCDFVQNSGDY